MAEDVTDADAITNPDKAMQVDGSSISGNVSCYNIFPYFH